MRSRPATAAALVAVVLLGVAVTTGRSQGQTGAACVPVGRLAELAEQVGERAARFVVTLAATEDPQASAAALRRAGALSAEPVVGQLLVVEASGRGLPALAAAVRIVCVQLDSPVPPG